MRRTLLKLIVASSLFSGLSLLSPQSAKSITINFSDPSTDELSEIEDLGLKITGSGEVTFLSGLGIKGGGNSNDSLVDEGESVTFSFVNSLADSVGSFSNFLVISGNAVSPGTGSIEGFGVGGASLGIVNINTFSPLLDVSNLFSNQLLSGFTFTADLGTGRNFAQISYELVPNEVPEPSFLLGLGVIGLAGIRGLKRKKI